MKKKASLSRTVSQILLASSIFFYTNNAFAWGDEGHQIIGLVAEHFIRPSVLLRIKQILSADRTKLTSQDIASESTWADKYRDSDRSTLRVRYNQTHNWHFIDLELDKVDSNAACNGHPRAEGEASMGNPNDCVVDKIDQFATELASTKTSDQERLLALQFLLHLIGDLHQPMHASNNHDFGGNSVNVSADGFSPNNLHHYWDADFVNGLGRDPNLTAYNLISNITPTQIKLWSAGSTMDWAIESYQVAVNVSYGELPYQSVSGSYQLNNKYVFDSENAVRVQLAKAGVRTAAVLNRALTSESGQSSQLRKWYYIW